VRCDVDAEVAAPLPPGRPSGARAAATPLRDGDAKPMFWDEVRRWRSGHGGVHGDDLAAVSISGPRSCPR